MLYIGNKQIDSPPLLSVNDLTDTSITNPAYRSILSYDGGKWVNKMPDYADYRGDIIAEQWMDPDKIPNASGSYAIRGVMESAWGMCYKFNGIGTNSGLALWLGGVPTSGDNHGVPILLLQQDSNKWINKGYLVTSGTIDLYLQDIKNRLTNLENK